MLREWVLIGTASGDKHYADPSTKSRTENVVSMWLLQDYAKPIPINGRASYSSRTYEQYDCAEKTRRPLQVSFFSGQMLAGETLLLFSQTSDKVFIAPDTIDQAMLNFACE